MANRFKLITNRFKLSFWADKFPPGCWCFEFFAGKVPGVLVLTGEAWISMCNQLVKYKEENKDIISETDFQYQNENIINKINNIKSILTNSDNQEETDIINFNITLIDKNSYIFAAYPTFKLFLFKNLHCVEELTEEQKKGNYEDINKLLTDNYNLLSKDVLVNIKNNNTMMIKYITDFLNINIKKDEKNKDEGEDDEE
jgi:hypothetical protein